MGFAHEIDEETFQKLHSSDGRLILTADVHRVVEVRVNDWPYWVYRSLGGEWITATGAGAMQPPFVEWLELLRVEAELAHPEDNVCSVGRAFNGQWYGWVVGVFKPCDSRELAVSYVREMIGKFSRETGPAFGFAGFDTEMR